ncbi:MAG: lysophospholipid acyltransferase family protein [Chthoniobacterales bacterium]
MGKDKRLHTQRFVYRWLYQRWIFEWLDSVVEILSHTFCHRIADIISGCYTRTHPRIVDTVADNLQLLTNAPVSKKKAAKVFWEFARCIADYTWLGKQPAATVLQHCSDYTGIEHMTKALANKRGAILATAHFSLFEFGSIVLQDLNLPLTILTHTEPNEELTQWRADYRARWGAKTIELGDDQFQSLRVVHELAKNRLCAMLVDRPTLGGSSLIQMPGGSMYFSTSAALLAYLADCPILPVLVRRDKAGLFQLIAKPPIFVERTLDKKQALETATQKVATALISEIRKTPTQWFQFIPIRADRADRADACR